MTLKDVVQGHPFLPGRCWQRCTEREREKSRKRNRERKKERQRGELSVSVGSPCRCRQESRVRAARYRYRNETRLRRGLIFKAQRRLYRSTLVIKKKIQKTKRLTVSSVPLWTLRAERVCGTPHFRCQKKSLRHPSLSRQLRGSPTIPPKHSPQAMRSPHCILPRKQATQHAGWEGRLPAG